MTRILLVDDDQQMSVLLKEWLEANQYEVLLQHNGISGRAALKGGGFDIVVLDWDMPGASGLDLCREYKESGGAAPVLMLTGRSSVASKEAGFEAGADDFLVKPFQPRELAARLKNLLRRSAPAATPPQVQSPAASGNLLLDRYELLNPLGEGAMGFVYKAKDTLLNRTVALKMLKAHSANDQESLHRFKLEAQAVSQLAHPNIVTIFDYGSLPDGSPCIVMEYLEGRALHELLQEIHQIPLRRALRYFIDCCAALFHAHGKGVIHRDLKPSNIMLIDLDQDFERVKIVDFGILKLVERSDLQSNVMTSPHQVFGSPCYMSPEQCTSKLVDQRSDIFSLGCVFYECLTGIRLFLGNSDFDTMLNRFREKPLPMTVVRPDLDLPQALESIVFRMLEVEPDRRYDSAKSVREDLENLAYSLQVTQ
jgi:serine/threonine-protein kinase